MSMSSHLQLQCIRTSHITLTVMYCNVPYCTAVAGFTFHSFSFNHLQQMQPNFSLRFRHFFSLSFFLSSFSLNATVTLVQSLLAISAQRLCVSWNAMQRTESPTMHLPCFALHSTTVLRQNFFTFLLFLVRAATQCLSVLFVCSVIFWCFSDVSFHTSEPSSWMILVELRVGLKLAQCVCGLRMVVSVCRCAVLCCAVLCCICVLASPYTFLWLFLCGAAVPLIVTVESRWASAACCSKPDWVMLAWSDDAKSFCFFLLQLQVIHGWIRSESNEYEIF